MPTAFFIELEFLKLEFHVKFEFLKLEFQKSGTLLNISHSDKILIILANNGIWPFSPTLES